MNNINDDCENMRLRLNRAIAQSGLCSRRKADELIFSGKVKVNGMIQINPALQVGPEDRLEVAGKIIERSPALVYLMLNKPVHTVCTASDPQGRQTVLDIIDPRYKNARLYPVGRLDYFSEGLLLLTNDGELANRLMHPRHHLVKIYEVTVRGPVARKQLACMREGMELEDGRKLLPVGATSASLANGNTRLRLELRQGVNRQIRRMCALLGLTILRLRRVAEGPLQLGALAAGQARQLTAEEVASLYQAARLSRESCSRKRPDKTTPA